MKGYLNYFLKLFVAFSFGFIFTKFIHIHIETYKKLKNENKSLLEILYKINNTPLLVENAIENKNKNKIENDFDIGNIEIKI